ncbi:hypothetical protein K7432_016539, partial [Basidiobolus ranarum]
MLEHSSIVNYIHAHQNFWNLKSDDTVLQFANYTFDASVMEIFATLAVGARVAVVPKESMLTDLEGSINKMNVTSALLMTTIASYINPVKVPCMKRLMVGGEMVTTAVRNSWAPHVELSNVYGPTESTVICLANPKINTETSCSIVGKPIGNTKIYILDAELRSVPVGVVGELCLSGPQLARGYLNRPELTESTFVVNSNIADRIYRTGDLARFSADGSIELIGRKDNQIKLHGLRIELGEVEHALNEHSQIGRACAIPLVTDTSTNHKALVAFLTFSGLESGSSEVTLLSDKNAEVAAIYIEEIKEIAKEKLPTYMIPSVWIPLNKMPLNSGEKIDRKKLAALFETLDTITISELGASHGATIIQPTTETEKTIQKIWSEVLKIPQESISMDHSFRHLGGDSILAIQVSSLCRKNQIQIPVQNMLQQQNISQLAELVQSEAQEWYKPVECSEGTVVLSPNHHTLLELKQDNINHFNISWLFKMRNAIGVDSLTTALRKLIEHHDVLRARFSCADDEWQMRILPADEVLFKVHHAFVNSVEEIKTHVHQLQRSLDIISGPLFQFSLYNTSDGQQLIFMTVHHFLLDLLSWRIIWEDLEQLLQGQECGYKSLSFMQWSQVLYDHAQTLDLTSWPVQPKPEPICTDPELLAGNTMATVRSLLFKLDAYFTKLANRHCNPSVGVEILDLLIASLAHSYCSVFGRKSLTVQLEFHGRQFGDNRIDISRTVGWFTNVYPVVVSVGEYDSVLDTLRQTVSQVAQIRGNEATYGLLRYLNEQTAPAFENDPLQVFLGYYPQSLNRDGPDSLLQTIPSDSEYSFDLEALPLEWKRPQIVGEQLEASIKYSANIFSESLVQNWLDSWEESLIEAVISISNERNYAVEDGPPRYISPHESDVVSLPGKSGKV